MLSFHIVEELIQIDCDQQGLQTLISTLLDLQKKEAGHVHLRAPNAGGTVLSNATPWGDKAVDEVVVSLGGE